MNRSTVFALALGDRQSGLGEGAADREKLCKMEFDSEAYSVQRRNSNAPLVPPNPNELDMAYSSCALRAWLGT
jgi:hypothetical protein